MSLERSYFAIKRDSQGVEYITSPDEVIIVALGPGNIVYFITEPAPAFGENTLLLPGGTVEDSEELAVTANRELQEELGYRAGELTSLGELRPWSKYLAVRTHVFLARDLIVSRLLGDEDYEIHIAPHPLRSWENLIKKGHLHDARVIAALYLTKSYLQKINRQSMRNSTTQKT